MEPLTMTQAEFSEVIGCTQQNVSKMRKAGRLVAAGSGIDVWASIHKLLEESDRKAEIDKWRATRLRQQCEAYDKDLAGRLEADTLRALNRRLRPLKEVLAKAAQEGGESVRLAICEAIDEAVGE